MVLNEASKISAQNVIVDISDVDFQNEAIPASMFTGNPDNKITVLNFIFPQNYLQM